MLYRVAASLARFLERAVDLRRKVAMISLVNSRPIMLANNLHSKAEGQKNNSECTKSSGLYNDTD